MFAALLALALCAQPAASLGSSEPAAARFKSLFTQGEQLYREGDFGGAIWSFKQADKLRATPEVAFDLAQAYQKLNDTAYSTYYFRLYLRRAPGAPDSLAVAERIGEALGEAELRGRGFLELESSEPGAFTVDGRRFEESPVAMFLPPGDYELAGTFQTGTTRKTVSLLTGKVTTVKLSPPEPQRALAPASRSPAPAAAVEVVRRPASTTRQKLHTASLVGGSVGAAALLAGAALGTLTHLGMGRYQAAHSTMTRTEAEGRLTSLNRQAAISDGLLVGGGAALAVFGVTFLFTLPEPGAKR